MRTASVGRAVTNGTHGQHLPVNRYQGIHGLPLSTVSRCRGVGAIMTNGDVEDARPICPDCQTRMDCTGSDSECTWYECGNCGYQLDECDDPQWDDFDDGAFDDDGRAARNRQLNDYGIDSEE